MQEKKEKKVRHVAIIMDGNRRWARENNVAQLKGHRKGYQKLKDVVQWCIDLQVSYLTVYGFSTENWNRAESEVSYLMDLIRLVFKRDADNLIKKGVRIKVVGVTERFPKDIQRSIEAIEETQVTEEKLVLQLALSYGGRPDITQAVRSIGKEILRGEFHPDAINDEMIGNHLWTAGVPDPDLIIRTGGEMRLSNFLTWNSVYSELYFTEVFWPAFSREDFEEALKEFSRRQRRFGK